MAEYLRPEHPMPQFYRDTWVNLNGEWEFYEDYSVSAYERGAMKPDFDYPLTINVPFCRESVLSGLGHTDFCDSVWYRKKISIPESFKGKRTLLHIGACDYKTTVYVNGRVAAKHIGGYVPVNADITDLLCEGENVIVVHALDFLRDGNQPGGKQCGNSTLTDARIRELRAYGRRYGLRLFPKHISRSLNSTRLLKKVSFRLLSRRKTPTR